MGQCTICEEEKRVGIHLYQVFICLACERKLVQTEVKEDEYRKYIQKLKHKNGLMLYL